MQYLFLALVMFSTIYALDNDACISVCLSLCPLSWASSLESYTLVTFVLIPSLDSSAVFAIWRHLSGFRFISLNNLFCKLEACVPQRILFLIRESLLSSELHVVAEFATQRLSVCFLFYWLFCLFFLINNSDASKASVFLKSQDSS